MDPDLAAHAVAARPFSTLDGRRVTLLLHGFGSHERDLLPLAAALPVDEVVIALRAPQPVGPGFSWSGEDPGVVLSGVGLDAAADAVLRFLDAQSDRYGTPSAVRLLGFSQGGALALTALRRAPGRFERVVVLSAFLPATAETGDAALAEHPVPVLWARGDADPVIPPAAIARTATWLETHATATVVVEPGLGHGVDDRVLARVAAFLR